MGANPSRIWIITTYADSESRFLTLGHPHKHCITSLLHELGSGKSIGSTSQKKSLSFLHNSQVLRNLLWNVCWWNHSFFQNYFLQQDCACFLIKSWVLWVMAHFNTCITLTHPWSYYCSIFQHYISFKSNTTSFLPTLGVTIITETKLQLICPNSNYIWNNIFLSIGQVFTQTSIVKKYALVHP